MANCGDLLGVAFGAPFALALTDALALGFTPGALLVLSGFGGRGMNGLRGATIQTNSYQKKFSISNRPVSASVGLDRDSKDKLSVALSEARD